MPRGVSELLPGVVDGVREAVRSLPWYGERAGRVVVFLSWFSEPVVHVPARVAGRLDLLSLLQVD